MDFSGWIPIWETVYERVAEMIPVLVASFALVLLGWVLALACRIAVGKILKKVTNQVETRLDKAGSPGRWKLLQTFPRLVGSLLYWSILLFFVAVAVEQLPFPIVQDLFRNVAAFLPTIILAVAVLFGGVVLGNLMNHWISDITLQAGIRHPAILGRLAQVVVIVLTAIITVQLVGLEGSLFIALATVILGSILGGMGLAFGLGTGQVVSNIMASYYASKALAVGDVVRFGETKGTIREITSTSIILDVDGDRVHLPAKKYCDEVCVLIGANR